MIDIKTIAIPKREGNSGGTTVINSGGGSGNSFSSVYIWGQYFDGTSDVYGDIKRVRNLYASGDINAEQDVNAKNLKSTNAQIQQYLDLVSNIYTPQIRMGTDTSDYDNNISIQLCNEEGFYFTDKDRNLGFGIMSDYLSCGLDIGSSNFYTGVQGWRVTNDGTAEFQNLKVNGNLDVYSITYNEMKATNGILLVTDAAQILKVVEDENTGDWVFTTDEYPPFAQDDIVQVQYKVSQTRMFQMKGEVVSVAQDGENTVRVAPYNTATGFSYNSTATSADRLGVTKFTAIDIETCQGKYLIRIGNKTDSNRQTIIKLNPYDGGYIDFLADCSTLATAACNDSTADSNKGVSRTRLGELSGIVYNDTSLSGYGLYSDNVYLTGGIKNLDNKWQLNRDGSGQVAQNKIYWDTSGNLTIKLSDTSTLDDVINNIETQINVLPGQIELSVYDNLEGDLRRTGIDISTGKIILQADNTDVSGNLNITGDDSYFQFVEASTGDVKFKMGNYPIPAESKFTGIDIYGFISDWGATAANGGTYSGETEAVSIGYWRAGTVKITPNGLSGRWHDSTTSSQMQIKSPNVQYSLTPVFLKKVENSYVELGRYASTSSGYFVNGEATNTGVGAGEITLSSSSMDGQTQIEVFLKYLWVCTGESFTASDQYHKMSFHFFYTPSAGNLDKFAYFAYNGFGFKYGLNNYIYSDSNATTINNSNGGYFKVDWKGVHIQKDFHLVNSTQNLLYDYGIYYSTEYHEQNGKMTIVLNRENAGLPGDPGTRGEEWKHLNFTGHSMVFQTNHVGTYRYFVGGQYHEQFISTDSYTDLFTIPANSETTWIWMGDGWLIYCKSLG